MTTLFNFFALRPAFTFSGLKFVWYLYLTHVIIQLYTAINAAANVMAQRGISWEAWAPNSVYLAIDIVAQVCLVRILLEVAAAVLLSGERH